MNTHFVGFGSLETWLMVADRSRPVNAESIIEPGQGRDIAINTQIVMVSQAQGNEILYCRIIIGRYQSLAGDTEPLGGSYSQIRERAESAWQIIKEVLAEKGLTIRECLVAMPKNLKVLDACAECLHYNKTTKLYERTNQQDLAADPAC